MNEITRVGVDLAKNVIQVHGVDSAGQPVVRRELPRGRFLPWCAKLPAGCEVAMEACSGAHHWARQLMAMGFQVKLIAPQHVLPYRLQGKHGKNDANDAAAVCEAASRPQMHFVPVKSVQQQSVLAVHRMREAYKAERSGLINRIRALLAEFGLAVPLKPQVLRAHVPGLLEDATNELPGQVRVLIMRLMDQWRSVDQEIAWCEQQIAEHARSDERCRRAGELLGVGPIGASALIATVGEMRQFTGGRQLAAWIGLAPRQASSGGKQRLGGISKHGDAYLRMLLVQGAKSALQCSKPRDERVWRWADALRQRIGWQRAAVALAAKNARILWAMLAREQAFVANHVSIKPT